ncbi:hypothetical protein J6590_014673 [Homalodisca vitripennis]|nr:hypothetical protein J6590_014673 [Homalodisca vitripennis]
MLEDRHIGLKDFGRSMPALPCFGMNTTLDTLQDSGMYLRATEALNSLHSCGRRMSNPRCKQTGLTPSPSGALLASSEAKIEELEEELENYSRRLEDNIEKSTETEAQLAKEKQYNHEIQNICEEHDKLQDKHIREYESKISILNDTILRLKREASERNLTSQHEAKPSVCAGTQTANIDEPPIMKSPTLLMELAQLKS